MKRTQGNRQAIGKTVLPEVNYTKKLSGILALKE
jgi:hypothetical protein